MKEYIRNKYFLISGLRVKYKLLLAGLAAALVILFVLVLTDGNANKYPDSTSPHNCAVGQFTKQIEIGKTAEFDVFLDASRFWRTYRVALDELPKGVTGEVTDIEGRGDGTVRISLNAGEQANPGNFSLSVLFTEKRGGNEYVTRCPYNLILAKSD